jgi:hypothetical protein
VRLNQLLDLMNTASSIARLLLSLMLTMSALIPCRAVAGPSPSGEPEVLDISFGTFNPGANGDRQFTPTRVVPHVVDQSYGWIAQLRTSSPKVAWREEMTLPLAPESWGEVAQGCRQTLSVDRRTATTECEAEPLGGFVFNIWGVAKDDPKGRYSVRIFFAGRLARSFDFDVR